MFRLFIILATVVPLAFATSVDAREKEATTPSGRPEMVFAHMQMPEAVSQVSSGCMDRGWMVTSQINNQVVCEMPMGVFQSAMTQMLIGNRYSTPPKAFARFSLGQVADHTRVQAQAWAETQMAFGQTQHHQYQDDGTYNNLMNFMSAAGAQLPIGTAFNSHAYLGVNGEAAEWKNGRRTQYGWRIIIPNDRSPAYRMGLRSGDILAKINNRLIKKEEDVSRLLDRQRVGQAMSVTVVRNEQQLDLEGIAEGRPSITMLIKPEDVPTDVLPVAFQFLVAHTGSLETALAQSSSSLPTKDSVSAIEADSKEDELSQLRREAAEAQAKLADLEAKLVPEKSTDNQPKS